MTQSSQPASFVEIAARKREPMAYGLIAGGVLMLALTIFWAIRWQSGREQPAQPLPPPGEEIVQPEDSQPQLPTYTDRSDYLPTAIWGGMFAALLLIAGGFAISRKPAAGQEVYETRLLLLIVGGAAGVLTALLGFVLAWRWQEELVRWVSFGATGGSKWVVGALAIFLAGLVLMFFSLQLARAEERSSVLLRRVLYGSNAVLTGLLVLLLLAVVNIVVFLKLPDNMITTATGFKGLGDPSKEVLHSIGDEVKVYLIMPETMSVPITRDKRYNGLYADCRTMLSACQHENSRIKVVPLSPATDAEEITRTMKRLKVPDAQVGEFGMLIGYGKGEELSAFISFRELFIVTEGGVAFQGENKLLNELIFLAGGGKRPVVYFTQSNDEPAINDSGSNRTNVRKMLALVEYLQEKKYEVRPLLFERGKKPDLTEATMVVVVAPRIPFDQEQLDILDEYLKPKSKDNPGGKLVALLPAFAEVGSESISKTGLEPLLGAYDIIVEPKQGMFSLPNRELPRFEWVAGTNTNEIRQRGLRPAYLLPENKWLPFGNVRPISKRDTPSGARRNSIVLNVLATQKDSRTYRDDRLNSDPTAIYKQIVEEAKKGPSKTVVEKQVTNLPVPFAAYAADLVEDGGNFLERPRVLAIGTDWFAMDEILRSPRVPQLYIEMMGAMLEFMREKPPTMYIEPRALGTYSLPKTTDEVGLVVLPIVLTALGIMGLGVGVWLTRRR